MTQRRYILALLSIGVVGVSLHNIYQSSNMSQLRWIHDKSLLHQTGPHAEYNRMAIQIIAGGFNNSLSNIIFDDIDMHLKQHRHSLDNVPGQRKQQSRVKDLFLPEANHSTNNVLIPEMALDSCRLAPGGGVYKTVNGTIISVPYWQQKLQKCHTLGHSVNGTWKYVLAELLQVRIYSDDKAKWTVRELKQWMHYMFLAGVEHIFLCDHYKYESERLDVALGRYIALKLVTYIPWSGVRNPMQSQIKCYQHIIDTYRKYTTWQIAVDMDEYPYSTTDGEEGFLVKYLRKITSRYGTRISEISINNFLMLGQGDRKRDMVIERINRMTPKPANYLSKPLYRPERVRANIHHNRILFGAHVNANNDEMRMLHYWGARVQDWGPDTNHTLAITTTMNGMRDKWAKRVRDSLLAFGEYDAFSNQTGP